MINLLSNALPYLQGLIKNEKIKIVNKYIENVNGFSKEFNLSLEAVAHVQPVNPKELIKLTSGTLDSNSYYKFWIIGDLANVLNSLNKTDCEIVYKNEKYSVFSKEDWSQNGWIMVIGSLKDYNV